MLYVLSDLPPVDAVEVIVFPTGEDMAGQIRRQHPDLSPEELKPHLLAVIRASRNLLYEPKGLSGTKVEGDLAQQVASLWRQLPHEEQMRCHIPPFLLRFWSGANAVLTASMCWQCNNIWITEGIERKFAHFDGESDVVQRLLRLLEEIVATRKP